VSDTIWRDRALHLQPDWRVRILYLELYLGRPDTGWYIKRMLESYVFPGCDHLGTRPGSRRRTCFADTLRAHVVRACRLVPCARRLCHRTRGEWQALNLTSRRTCDRTGDLVVRRSNRGLYDNIRLPGFRPFDVPFPGWTQVRLSIPAKATGNPTDPRVHLLAGEISPIRFSDFCAPSWVFV
jgi:hypothetical protein